MADKKPKAEEEKPEEKAPPDEPVVEAEPEVEPAQVEAENTRLLTMRGKRLLGYITPAQRSEIKAVIAAELKAEADADAAMTAQARVAKALKRKRQKQGERQKAGQAALAADGHGPLEPPSYASFGAPVRTAAAENDGCSTCGGE